MDKGGAPRVLKMKEEMEAILTTLYWMDFFQSNLSMGAIASSCTKNMGRGGKQSLATMRTAMMRIIPGEIFAICSVAEH